MGAQVTLPGLLQMLRRGSHWLTSTFWERRLWIFAVLALAALLTKHEASSLLGTIHADGQYSYTGGVLDGFTLSSSHHRDLATAWEIWGQPSSGNLRATVIGTLVIADLVFIGIYCWGLLVLFHHYLNLRWRFACLWVLPLVLFDAAETFSTALLLKHGTGDFFRLTSVLTVVKSWAFLLVLAAALVGLARRGIDATEEVGRFRRAYDAQGRPLGRLRAHLVVVGVLVVVGPAPIGGPLDQFPEVLRIEYENGHAPRSAGWLLLLAFALLISANRATLLDKPLDTPIPRGASGQTVTGPMLLLAAVVWSVVVTVLRIREPFVDAAGGPFDEFGRSLGLYAGPIVLVALTAPALLLSAPEEDPGDEEDEHQFIQPMARQHQSALRNWGAAIALSSIVAGLLAGYRATLTPSLVDGQARLWLELAGLGVAAVLVPMVFSLVRALSSKLDGDPAAVRAFVYLVVPWAVGAVGVALTFWPAWTVDQVGTSGVVLVALSCAVLGLGWLDRHRQLAKVWQPVRRILPKVRYTPYLSLLLATAVLASLLDTGGYFSVSTSQPAPFAYERLSDAFAEWGRQATDCMQPASSSNPKEVRPLIMVAAPGGGIRAAYWTAQVLDLIGADCPENVFAVSGVSGGSLGTVAWAWPDKNGEEDISAKARVARIASGRPLALGLAGLFFRDLPHALLPFQGLWDDRDTLMEDAMADEMSPEFGSADFSSLTSPGGTWKPVLALNGTSAGDGCRVVTSNVGNLTETVGGPCPSADTGAAGVLTAALDSRAFGRQGVTRGSDCGNDGSGDSNAQKTQSFSAISAVMLSARFPLISPAGSMRRCVADPAIKASGLHMEQISVVDGGYAENSGLLTLLQIWRSVAALVREHNQDPNRGYDIEPIFVLADNHYLGAPDPPNDKRLRETLVPVSALGSAKESFSPSAFLRLACLEVDSLSSDPGACNPALGRGVAVLSPVTAPQVAAPLGWALSNRSLKSLSEQADTAWTAQVNRTLRRMSTICTPPSAPHCQWN